MTNLTMPDLTVPFDRVMFLLRNIAEYRRVAKQNWENANDASLSTSTRGVYARLAETSESMANTKEQVLFTLFGEDVIKNLASSPEAQPR